MKVTEENGRIENNNINWNDDEFYQSFFAERYRLDKRSEELINNSGKLCFVSVTVNGVKRPQVSTLGSSK
jgi:hypothetical protein